MSPKLFLQPVTWALLMLCLLSGCNSVDVKRLTFVPSDKGAISEQQLNQRGIESLSITTQDAQRLYAIYLPNKNSDSLIIYFHGNGGNVHQRILALEKLKSLGSNVLSISYRGYFNSTGVASEAGVYEDAKATLNHAIKELKFNENTITVFGRSLGSAIAIDLAQSRRLAGLVLVSPFTNSLELFNTLSSMKKRLISDPNGFIKSSFRNSEKTRNIETPTLVIHGTHDNLIPFRMGKAIFDSLPGEKSFIAIEGGKHNNFGYQNFSAFDNAYWLAVDAFLQQREIHASQ